MTTVVVILVTLTVGFVAGILVGRRNAKKVESVVSAANTVSQVTKAVVSDIKKA